MKLKSMHRPAVQTAPCGGSVFKFTAPCGGADCTVRRFRNGLFSYATAPRGGDLYKLYHGVDCFFVFNAFQARLVSELLKWPNNDG